jgi:O-antigen/teichoic acid export membrane protein
MSIRAAFLTSFVRRGGQFVLQFVASMILARLILPADLGIFAVALAILAILAALREMGTTRYIIKERDLTDDKIRTVFGFTLLTGWSLAVLIWALRDVTAGFYSEPQLADVLTVLAVNFVLVPIGQPAMALMRRERRYGDLAIIALAATFAGICASVYLAWQGFGAMALAWGSLLETAGMVAMALWFRPDHIRLMPSLKEWRDVGSFSGIASAEALIVQAGMQLPQVLIGKFFAFADVGLYVRGQRLAHMMRTQFMGSVTWVTGAEFGARHRDGGALGPLVTRITDYALCIAWPVLVFLALKAESVIFVLFGPNWIGAAPFLQILCLAQGIHMMYDQAQSVYEATGDIRLKFRNEVILQFASIALLLIALRISLEAVAWSRSILALGAVVVHLGALKKHSGVGLPQLALALRRPFLVTVAFAAVLLALDMVLGRLTSNAFYTLGAEVLAAILVFPAILKVFNPPLLGDILKMLPARLALNRRTGNGPG